MKTNFILQYVPIGLLVVACAGSQEEQKSSDLKGKQAALQAAYNQLHEVQKTISSLEEEIQKENPRLRRNVTLVSTFVAEKNAFEHRIQARGNVQSRKNIRVSAQTIGIIDRVYVKEGNRVNKGQLLISINADVLKNTIAEYETMLELASSVYEKQEKLWSQNVGTEVQYLQAKNNKESLERKLLTARSQLDWASIRAPFAGTIEQVYAREGEMAALGSPIVSITSPKDIYLSADVSEKYVNRFHVGDEVDVFFPSHTKQAISSIEMIGQVINYQNRTFIVEVSVPKINFQLQPNQVVILNFRDYYNEATWVVPTRIIQRDKQGEFIFIVEDKENKMIAKKLSVKTGLNYKGNTEILKGLVGKEHIVYKGFNELTDGSEVNLVKDQDAVVKKDQQ